MTEEWGDDEKQWCPYFETMGISFSLGGNTLMLWLPLEESTVTLSWEGTPIFEMTKEEP